MINNKFLLHWIARAFLDVIAANNEESAIPPNLLEHAEYIITCTSQEDFECFVIDSASIALDIVLSVARAVFNDESIVGVPDLVVMTGVEDTFEVTEEIITQMLVFAVSSFECPSRETFVRNILQLDQEIQEYLMKTIQTTLQQQAGASDENQEEVEEGEFTQEEVEMNEDTRDENVNTVITEDVFIDNNNSMMQVEEDNFQKSSQVNTTKLSSMTTEESLSSCFNCQYFEQQVEKMKHEKLQERKVLEAEINELKNSVATETSRLVDTELVLQEKDRVLKELEAKLADHDQLQSKLDELSRNIAEKTVFISSLQDQLDVDRTKLEKFDTMEKNLTKMKEKLSDLKEVQQQLKAETEAHSHTYQSLIAAEQTVQELRPFQSQVEEYRLELAEKAIALSDVQAKLKETELQMSRLQGTIAVMEAGKQAMLSSQSHLAEELLATSEELRSKEKFNALGEGMSEFNPMLMQELSKLRAENADLWNKLDRTSLDAVEKLQREVADQKAIAKSLTEKWQTTKTTLEHTARDLDTTRRQLLELTLLHQQLQATKNEHDAMLTEDLQQQIDQKCALFQDLVSTQGVLQETKINLQEESRKRKRETEENETKIATLTAQHEQSLAAQQEQFEETEEDMREKHAGQVAEMEQKLMLLQADLDQEVVKRRKVERLKKLYETESQRQRLQLQHLTTAQETNGGMNSYAQGDFDVAAKEIRSLQEKLDDAHREIQQLKTQQFVANSATIVHNSSNNKLENVNSSNKENLQGVSSTLSSLRKPPLRVLNPSGSSNNNANAQLSNMGSSLSSSSSSAINNNNNNNGSSGNGKNNSAVAMMNYAEQAELHDKQLEQLAREKRELLSKSLEENREKMELSQRLLALDKENAQLKADLRKRTLEKERLERNMLKSGKMTTAQIEADN